MSTSPLCLQINQGGSRAPEPAKKAPAPFSSQRKPKRRFPVASAPHGAGKTHHLAGLPSLHSRQHTLGPISSFLYLENIGTKFQQMISEQHDSDQLQLKGRKSPPSTHQAKPKWGADNCASTLILHLPRPGEEVAGDRELVWHLLKDPQGQASRHRILWFPPTVRLLAVSSVFA